jgi:hypothetical protein
MAGRVPYFELHIRPLFRIIDRDHMLARGNGLDLWDYDAVVREARTISILLRSGQPMPPFEAGGPWPDEWVALFDRWVASGCPRLQIGKAPSYVLEQTSPRRYRLTCDVPTSLPDCVAFFDLADPSPANRTYTLYVQPPVPAPAPSPSTAPALEMFRSSDLIGGVHVIDADGKKFVPLPSA